MVVSSTLHTTGSFAVAVRLVVRGLLCIAKGPASKEILGAAWAIIMERMMGASGTMFVCWLLLLMVCLELER